MSARSPSITKAEYLRRWSALHGDMNPADNWLVAFWLGVVFVLARPFVALGASPNAVTGVGAVVSLIVVGAADAGGRWVLPAGVLVLLSGVLDNLDGAVAVMTGKSSKWGYVLDSMADRVADVCYLVALWLVGAPAWVVVAAGALTFLQEYVRARAGAAGMSEIGVVSVWERPSRVLVAGLFLVAAGIHLPWASLLVTIGAAVSLVLSLVGNIQVITMVRRRILHMAEVSTSTES